MGRNPSTFEGCAGDCPVDSITWFDAASYRNYGVGARLARTWTSTDKGSP